MRRTSVGIGFLLLFGILGLVQSLLGEWLAPLIQAELGGYINLWTVGVPFAIIGAGLIGFEIRDRLADQPEATPLTSASVPHTSIPNSNRTKMINKVRAIWIDGLLRDSLYNEVLLSLALTKRQAVVTRPHDLLVQRPGQVDQALPLNTQIIEVFDQTSGALLILGAPGAGKTTLLLELADNLLDRAKDDPTHPIPVIFPLSSWAEKRLPLTEWLEDELIKRYDLSRSLARTWVAGEQILPLLDGLDEVVEAHRVACVQAINTFREMHGLVPLVVCSRGTEYETLNQQQVRLRLQGAVVVQPLTRSQIRQYLQEVDIPMAPRQDSPLWELLDTPLMLNITVLTYAGQAPILPERTVPLENRDRLFAAYVARMFQRGQANTPYTSTETMYWLSSLAWQMRRHNQTIFHPNSLESKWLPQWQRWVPDLLYMLVGMLIGGLGGALGSNVLGITLSNGIVSGMFSGMSAVLLMWLIQEVGNVIPVLVTLFIIEGIRRAPQEVVADALKAHLQPIHVWPYVKQFIKLLIIRLVFSVAALLVFSVAALLVFGVAALLVFGVVALLVFAILSHRGTWLQNNFLRFLLVQEGVMPWDYVRFLDFAAQRILLRKVGSGYIFIHRLLLDYFADQYEAGKDKGV